MANGCVINAMIIFQGNNRYLIKKMEMMEELANARDNEELAKALELATKQRNIAIEGLKNIRDSYDPYLIAEKSLREIDELGQK